MRERYIETFDKIWIDNLHGDRIISEVAPDGRASETVFSIRGSSAGIQIGVAIVLMVGEGGRGDGPERSPFYRDLHEAASSGETSGFAFASVDRAAFDDQYQRLSPSVELGLPLKPRMHESSYLSWPRLLELFPVAFPGVKTSRDSVVVDMDRDLLIKKMETYFDGSLSNDELNMILPGR